MQNHPGPLTAGCGWDSSTQRIVDEVQSHSQSSGIEQGTETDALNPSQSGQRMAVSVGP